MLTVDDAGGVAADHGALRLVAPADSQLDLAQACYLGSDAEHDYFSGPGTGGPSLRELAGGLDEAARGLALHAVALANWHRTHRFCPRCGGPTRPEQGGHARRCARDASLHFPRQDPAVIMLVTDPAGRQAVLGRQVAWPPGRFSCLAGFVDAGETAEEAVVRECAEEAGLAVREVRWWGSQPWPFPGSLMLGFTAVADPAVLRPGDHELAEVAWFTRAEVRRLVGPPAQTIAGRLIGGWLEARPG